MDINKFTFYSPLNNFGREMLEVTYISLHFLITFALKLGGKNKDTRNEEPHGSRRNVY